jgi:membrane protease YdiL (CAAX protease family)
VVRSWTVADFALAWLAGYAGTFLFYAAGTALGTGDGLIVMGLAGQYVGNLGSLWLLSRRKTERDLGLSIEPRDLRYVALGIVLQIAIAILISPLARLLFPDGAPPQLVAEAIGDPDASTFLKLTLFSAAVLIAPLTEELLFRGALLKAFQRRGRWLAVVASAMVFAGVHLLGVDADRLLASAAVVMPPIFILGIILAWLTIRENRLGPAIFLHSGWNLLAAVVLLLPAEVLDQVTNSAG